MNQTELTAYVWAQTDTSEYDLPATTILNYLNEAFQRTIAAENRWPFYEKTWDVIVQPGDAWSDLDTDVNPPAVVSVTRAIQGWKLQQISEEEADLRFGSELDTGGFSPVAYSFWGGRINFWPRVAADEETTFKMRGFRKPASMFAANGEVDADERLHRPLAHYAVALAYAQQEDVAGENTYMERWQRDVELIRMAIMDPAQNRPIVMHGNFPRTPVGGPRGEVPAFTINTP